MTRSRPPRLPAADPVLRAELSNIGAPVGVRAIDRLAAAHDASPYILTPQAVVTARDADDVAATLAAARHSHTPVTFRSGGTSLSGQASTRGVLIDTRRYFRSVEVVDGGAMVRTGPGATVRAVNARLMGVGRRLGPDPASEIACTIGGIVANNSSGMCCGIHSNAYRTLESAVLVLPSGTIIDTGARDADDRLREKEPDIHAGLKCLRDRVRSNPSSVRTIQRLFALKNTMGYGVNSFLDFDRPIDILGHLIIGSEGTLAFVAEATFRSVVIKEQVATGFLVFPSLVAATAALPTLVDAGFAAIELMDSTSLRVAQRDLGAPMDLRSVEVLEHAALLVEFQEATKEQLEARVADVTELFATLPLVTPPSLTSAPAARAQLWHIRKGLFTAVAGNRPRGTTALLEDIAVPVDRLLATCTSLVDLFEAHGYENCVVFGHAKDGNVHFLLNERFDDSVAVARYGAFTEDMVDLVLAQGGTLKAEHGTGRIMAPFVRRQYGEELYEVMREIKALIDPTGLLNPGVLISDDRASHLHDLKVSQAVHEDVDDCVECGYCEPVCPSQDLTLTPRERIVIQREIALAESTGDKRLSRQLRREYEYDGVQTCAVDGMCQTACPVLINTGDLVRRLRGRDHHASAEAAWKIAATHWDGATRMAGFGLSLAAAMPAPLPRAATIAARGVTGSEVVPRYSADLPTGGARRRVIRRPHPDAVYFTSCTTTMFGPIDGKARGVSESLLGLCERAGIVLATPDELPSLCCGTPWKSKGFDGGYAVMREQVVPALWRATRHGELPVVCDASSCTEGLRLMFDSVSGNAIKVIDAVQFVDDHVLDKLGKGKRIASLTVHPTCSSTRLGVNPALLRIAAACAVEVTVPADWGCCAFAGDRGMLHPELTASATAAEAAAVVFAAPTVAHASLNRTCELGMTRATGQPFRHILEVLEQSLGGQLDVNGIQMSSE